MQPRRIRTSRSSRTAGPASAPHPYVLAHACALLALLVAGVAQAQPTPTPTPVAEEPKPVFQLDPTEVVAQSDALGPVDGYVAYETVTATKTETPLIETPQSVTVVTRDQMTAQNVQTVSEALLYSASVVAQPFGADNRGDFVFIRGFNQSENGIYFDSLRQQANGTGFRLEPYGLERVDVLRGPASVLYGQSAPGGLINQISKRPRPRASYEAILEGGSFDDIEAAFDVGGPIGDSDFSYRLVSLLRDSDTQVDFVPNDRAYVAPSIGWRPTADTEVVFLASFLYDDTALQQYLPPQGVVEPNPNGQIPVSRFVGEPSFNSSKRYQVYAGYSATHRAGDVWSLRQNLRFGNIEFPTKAVYGSGLEADLRTLRRFPFEDRQYGQNFLLDNQAEARWNLGGVEISSLFGLDYSLFEKNAKTFFGPLTTIDVFAPVYGQVDVTTPIPVTDIRSQQTQLGLYTQHQATLFERLVVLAGARFDWADNDVDDHLDDSTTNKRDRAPSWRVGVVYLTDVGIAPYGSYSTSFEPIAGTNLFGDPFDPSDGESGEVGLKYEPPGWNVFVTGALYQITQTNVLTPDPLNPLNQIQLGEVRSRGAEVQAVATLVDGLSAVASYSYSDIETIESTDPDVIGNRPSSLPAELISSWLDYTHPSGLLEGLGAGGGVRYVGPSFGDLDNTLDVPGYTLFDAVLHYETGPWRAALNVTNALDRTYATCFNSQTCFYGTGRTFLGSVRYRF